MNNICSVVDSPLTLPELIHNLVIELKRQGEVIDSMSGERLEQLVRENIDRLVDDGSMETFINQIVLANLNDKIDEICFLIGEPSTPEVNTQQLQAVLDVAKTGEKQVRVRYPNGTYQLKSCILYSNTTIECSSNTKFIHVMTSYYNEIKDAYKQVPILFLNALPYGAEDSQITGYNGHSNIKFIGGILECRSAFLLSHGRNIHLEGITMCKGEQDHYIQIGGCQNVTIKDCQFLGVTERGSNRHYVEMIQIDWLTSGGQPYWNETAPFFDSTINDNIVIDGCEFKEDVSPYNYIQCAIGSHSSDGDNKNTNITIKNCRIYNVRYGGLTMNRMKNVYVENNIINSSYSHNGNLIATQCHNLTVGGANVFIGGMRGCRIMNCQNVLVNGAKIMDCSNSSEVFLLAETLGANISNVMFENVTGKYGISSRNNHYAIISHNICINSAISSAFVNVYEKDDGTSEHIQVIDNICDVKQCQNSSKLSVFGKREYLIKEEINPYETILLDEPMSNFVDLNINISCYGIHNHVLDFTNTSQNSYTLINLPENSSGDIAFIMTEVVITKVSETELTFTQCNRVRMDNGVYTVQDPTNCTIKNISGTRVSY